MKHPHPFKPAAFGVLLAISSLTLVITSPAQLPGQQPGARIIAYEIPAGTTGNQGVPVGLGMDFDVELDIRITRIGVFDSGSDGLLLPITARLFDRDTLQELGAVEFTPESPGDLVGGSRFKEFEMDLLPGFHGTIVASGYGPEEPNGNLGEGFIPGVVTNDGGCAIQFTGSGRVADDPALFPARLDGGPPNRYLAGTFEYEPLDEYPIQQDATAYNVPAGTIGNQDNTNNTSLGMDFDVNVPIQVTRLGVFDSGQDGLFRTLTARIYLRDTQGELANLTFTPDDPGELFEGSRFKDLPQPLSLPPGFRGSIVAEGFGPEEPNGNGLGQGVPWAVNHGGCAISFVGGSRYGTLGLYPATVDTGPRNRYAAGTFEFEIDRAPPPPAPEPPPNLVARAGDGKVDLSWDVPGGPAAAARYIVFRSATVAGPFTQITEVTATQYTDEPLPNEVAVCYKVRAASAGGAESFDSAKVCAVPAAPPPPGRFVAYEVPEGALGTQAFGGALGLDFNVLLDIRIFRIGVFDDESNGLKVPITARLWDRNTQTLVAQVEFTPDDPGVLVGGNRFKTIDPPIDLFQGFAGTIVGSGYGASERNGNGHGNPADLLPWTTNDGGCRLAFVGSGRFGGDPTVFPPTSDGGPANRYASGTFEFEALGAPIDPTPQPPVNLAAEAADGSVSLSWDPPAARACVLQPVYYKIYRSENGDPAVEIARPTETSYIDDAPPPGADLCYAVATVAEGDRESAKSETVCATPGRHFAYWIPVGTEGTQEDPTPIGMDFDVLRGIRVARLGVFDSGSDGLNRDLLVQLFDRDTETELASISFTPQDAGLLLNGSRFKDLPDAVELPAGFHGSIVVEGYGIGEPFGLGGAWSTDSGPCSLAFVGTGRSLPGPTSLPLPNPFGRPDQYAAGTFQFEPMELGEPRGAIAYDVPQGTIGNQFDARGALGMDFDVNVPIRVLRLGVFDSGSDGLNTTITARLWDRAAGVEVVRLTFTTADPGELEGGSRFKPLNPPLDLPAGFRGTMVGSGYGPTEPNGNGHSGEAGVPWTTDDGGCAIQFVGRARYGPIPTLFPRTIDNGPANRYAAGTFEFEVEGGAAIPEPPTGLAAVPGDARVEISWQAPAGGSPAAGFNVYRSAAPGGPYTRLNPILIPAGVTRFTDASVEHCVEQCYVVRSVSAGGGESANSNEGCASDLCGSFRRGDVDGNGSLEITDPIAVLGNLFLGDPPVLPCFDSADVDDSGILDITDGVFSLSFQFLGGDPPPAPFPGCGVDPTVDEPGADFGCDYPAASCQ